MIENHHTHTSRTTIASKHPRNRRLCVLFLLCAFVYRICHAVSFWERVVRRFLCASRSSPSECRSAATVIGVEKDAATEGTAPTWVLRAAHRRRQRAQWSLLVPGTCCCWYFCVWLHAGGLGLPWRLGCRDTVLLHPPCLVSNALGSVESRSKLPIPL